MDQELQLEPVFTSVGVNRVVNTLDWGANGLIAYGGHSIVCLYDHKVRNALLALFVAVHETPTAQFVSCHRLRAAVLWWQVLLLHSCTTVEQPPLRPHQSFSYSR